MTRKAHDSSDVRKWNVPDWKDGSAYAYLKNLSESERRWEVLRRRPDYRKLWLIFGSAKAGFSLGQLIDPRRRGDSLSPGFRFIDERRRGWVLERNDASTAILDEIYMDGYMLVAVDLHRPIRPQLDIAASELASRQYLEHNPHSSRFPPNGEGVKPSIATELSTAAKAQMDGLKTLEAPYRVGKARVRGGFISLIRSVDATRAGATWPEIVREIWRCDPNEENTNDKRKQTKDFLDDFYSM